MFDSISYLEKLLFTKHLSVMTKAGIPLVESLDVLTAQVKSKIFKKVLISISDKVKNGQSFTKSLSAYPKIFDDFYLGLTQIGESSGSLEKNLDFLSKQMSKDYSLQSKIRSAMLYPGLVFGATFIMGGFISLFILPKLVDFFSAFDTKLPLATVILLFIANFMKNYGLIFFGSLVVVFVLGNIIINLPSVKPLYHQFLLKLPLVGELTSYSQLSRFSRNLGILIKSGIPLSTGLSTVKSTLSNISFQRDVDLIHRRLNQGKNIAESMAESKLKVFPGLSIEMISVGEKTGKLDETLLYLGDFYEDEIDDISKNLSTLLEPALLIFIGLIVAFVALAIISPIYQLTGSIQR